MNVSNFGPAPQWWRGDKYDPLPLKKPTSLLVHWLYSLHTFGGFYMIKCHVIPHWLYFQPCSQGSLSFSLSRTYFLDKGIERTLGTRLPRSLLSKRQRLLIIALKEVFLCSLALSKMVRQELRTSLVQKSAAERERKRIKNVSFPSISLPSEVTNC